MMSGIRIWSARLLILPLVGREIPVVADEYVDKEFGTGVVKITPAHDPNDFEVGKRHNLPEINILNDDATINEKGGKYAGMDRYEARKAMVEDLEEQGLSGEGRSPMSHNVGTHDRCKTTVEPMVKQQWFVTHGGDGKARYRGIEERRSKVRSGALRTRPICTGWKISATGVFPDSSGGDTGFRLITARTAARSW